MKRRHTLVAGGIDYGLKALMATCRIRIHGLEPFLKLCASRSLFLALFHDQMALVPHVFTQAVPLTGSFLGLLSGSRDAFYLEAFIRRFPNASCIKVPHDQRPLALKQLIKIVKHSHVTAMVTPDGPRGPRHKVKPGLALAAKHSEAPIVPFYWHTPNPIQLSSWDQFAIPRPFSTIDAYIGSAIAPEKHSVKTLTALVEEKLLRKEELHL